MTADGWIPTKGRRPELPPDTLVFVKERRGYANVAQAYPVEYFSDIGWGSDVFGEGWIESYRLAQPAAQEWRNCDLHKPSKDGDVVEIRDLVTGFDAVGVWTRGHWHVSHDRDSLPGRVYRHEYFDHLLHNAEWRYPAAGPSDAATINVGTEHGGQHLTGSPSQEGLAGGHAPVPAPLYSCANCGEFDKLLADMERTNPQALAEGRQWVKDTFKPIPAPYRSRNGYGLRIREADVRPREPLLISYDVFRRMK